MAAEQAGPRGDYWDAKSRREPPLESRSGELAGNYPPRRGGAGQQQVDPASCIMQAWISARRLAAFLGHWLRMRCLNDGAGGKDFAGGCVPGSTILRPPAGM
eukprot:scaffold447_cov307-Pinguiococcus_pyrenoidosus.AAC.58